MTEFTNDAPADRVITTTRVVKAPREQVFKAWTDPRYLAQWWGPKGFTNTFHDFDLKPGGVWRFDMHGPDGANYKNKSVFVEIAPPERLVFDHVSGHLFRAVATFEDAPGGTRITFRMIHQTAEDCERIKPIAVHANEENFDRLEAVLNSMAD